MKEVNKIQKKKSINQIQKEKFYAEGRTLPKCVNLGCDKDIGVRNWGNWSFKTECSRCQSDRKKNIIREGVTIHKKKFCENHDGHLGFLCPVPDRGNWKGFEMALDLDHIDGDHMNNDPDNVKTYCKPCHGRKSVEQGDCSNQKLSARSFDE
jgi:hypothetical protein